MGKVIVPTGGSDTFIISFYNDSSKSQPTSDRRYKSWHTTQRRGNITSFKQGDDNDDDQNTYNGNSTQQQ